MEIEIITTKKKLTKSMLLQMRHATNEVIINCEILGHIVNVHPSGTVALLQHCGDYYYIGLNWKKGEVTWTRPSFNRGKKYTQTKKFDTPELCDEI